VVHEMLNSDMNFNMSRVAKAIGRSRERVRQIFSAATQKLRLQLEAQGISSL
jgi:DNA-directed RNA polymerase sigma subunit (sigma70/sigma32)